MLDKNVLKELLKTAIQSTTFPASGPALSAAIVGYVQSAGTPLPPTISYTLGPASGASWALLIPLATAGGVSDYIISEVISKEFMGSVKVIPAVPAPITVGMVFNEAAKVEDLSNVKDYDETWDKISKAIIDFFKPEIE